MATTTSTPITPTSTGSAYVNGPVRVRFAPSPTGSLHVGGARTALFNYLLARQTNGTFVIRVEDTDLNRSTKESERSILSDLKWLGLNWQEGPGVDGPHAPYRQSERKEIYLKAAQDLIKHNYAYYCFSTEEELENDRKLAEEKGEIYKYNQKWRDADPELVKSLLKQGKPYTIRYKLPSNKRIILKDLVRGEINWDANEMLDDFILIRTNGMPVYNFCVSVDDKDMKITHVIRAEEHLTNTLRQLLIFEGLNYVDKQEGNINNNQYNNNNKIIIDGKEMDNNIPLYAHCSLILGKDRSKLSKRHGATSVEQFKKRGYLPQALVNYLSCLGFGDGTNKELYKEDEIIKVFDLARIIKSPAVFDEEKLLWINSQHIKMLEPRERIDRIFDMMYELNSFNNDNIDVNNYKNYIEKKYYKDSYSNSNTDSIEINPPETSKEFETLLEYITKISTRDMELLTQSRPNIEKCLKYDPYSFTQSLVNDLKNEISLAENEVSTSTDSIVSSNETTTPESVVSTITPSVISSSNSTKIFELKEKLKDLHHILSLPSFNLILNELIQNYNENKLPIGNEDNYHDIWKQFIKNLSKKLNLKGKNFFHPLRFLITGKLSGGELNDELYLVYLSSNTSILNNNNIIINNIDDRIKFLNNNKNNLQQDLLKILDEVEFN